MADKLRTMQNLEAMQARYVGTGHSDTTKYDWVSNIVRDSYASYIGHPPLLSYMSVGMGEPKEKVRAAMIQKMVRGAGNPPEVSARFYFIYFVCFMGDRVADMSVIRRRSEWMEKGLRLVYFRWRLRVELVFGRVGFGFCLQHARLCLQGILI